MFYQLRNRLLVSLVLATVAGCAAATPGGVRSPSHSSGASGAARADSSAKGLPAAGNGANGVAAQASLEAGAIDDNSDFAKYLSFVGTYQGQAMRALDVSERTIVRVVDADGKTVSNATVALSAGGQDLLTGKTYANGQLLFHPKAYPALAQYQDLSLRASKDGDTISAAVTRGQKGIVELKLPKAHAQGAAKLDLLFLIDTTGSMGGEIAKLQTTLTGINSRIQGSRQQPSVRWGLVAYKDRVDAATYVTQTHDFTPDLAKFQTDLNGLSAAGGGDYPEDMEAGLDQAVSHVTWGDDDRARLVFLIADAPPHIDYPNSIAYTTSMEKAAGKGERAFQRGRVRYAPTGPIHHGPVHLHHARGRRVYGRRRGQRNSRQVQGRASG
jgi:hypothetical protein